MCCKKGRKGTWINARIIEGLCGYDSDFEIEKVFYSSGFSKEEG